MRYRNIQELKRALNGTGATIKDVQEGRKQSPVVKRKATVADKPIAPMRVDVVLPMPPSANRYWRNYRGITVISDEAKAYKRFVARSAPAGFQLARGPLSIRLTFYFARRGADLDNRIKIALDSMQGLYFENDSQFDEIYARRLYDKNNPRVEVAIEAIR